MAHSGRADLRCPFAAQAQAADPIKIGFSMALTGGVAANGKQLLLALQIWRDDVNAKGGLLGRPVELVYYDDQSNPSTVPGIYTKLLNVDKVDLLLGPYAHQHGRAGDAGRHGAQADHHRHARRSASTAVQLPELLLDGAGRARSGSQHSRDGFFELAAEQNPKPQTVAIVGADAEFAQNALDGARENAKKCGFKIVYDKTLSAEHHRLHADRARHQGHQRRHRLRGRLSAGHGGHRARRATRSG